MAFIDTTPSMPVLLIVDDTEVIRQLCAQALNEYRILLAADGREALSLLEKEKVDLILTDVMMPGIDGLELLRRVKEERPNQVVVVMTGFADRDIILQALRSNADDFVTKPINLLQLRNVMRRALERQRLREELIELKGLDRLKGEFLGLISHKLKTPVTSVSLFLQNIADGSVDLNDSGTQQALSLAQGELKNLNQLIRDLLYYSDLILQPQPWQCQMTQPADPIASVLNDLLPDFHEHDINLHFVPPVALPEICLDNKQFDFILRALLLNALKFTPRGGKVELKIDATPEGLNLQISDNGIGIPAAELTKVFEKFYQVDPHHSGQVRGFGLGLYYVREFVQKHGGTISLTSDPGHGTTVTVRLPIS